MTELPHIVHDAWAAYGDPRAIVSARETSPGVSTNRVFRLDLTGDANVFCKVSSYGSYVHFRQDHQRVLQWRRALEGERFAGLLAPPLCKAGQVFTFRKGAQWLVFYEQAPHSGVLPKVVPDAMLPKLAEEFATLHRITTAHADEIEPTWITAGSDLATLFDRAASDEWSEQHGWTTADRDLIAHHCERFFSEAERLGYHRMHKIPVLVDWNRGNFSVRHTERGPRLFSRWDYDWFRLEPRPFDFYFLARVVRSEGDQTAFSYTLDPLLEPRFAQFLRHYHAVFPLEEQDLLFAREAYRFFLLNYVMLKGEHFFVPHLRQRLQHETLAGALARIDETDFGQLVSLVL